MTPRDRSAARASASSPAAASTASVSAPSAGAGRTSTARAACQSVVAHPIRHRNRRRRIAGSAETGDGAARRQVRIGERLVEVVDRRQADVDVREEREPGGARTGSDQIADEDEERGLVVAAGVVTRDPVGASDALAERLPELVLERAERDVAIVGRAVDVVAGVQALDRQVARVLVAARRRDRARPGTSARRAPTRGSTRPRRRPRRCVRARRAPPGCPPRRSSPRRCRR